MKNYVMLIGLSMLPLVELRGAIPVAVALDLPLVPSYLISVFGNLLPVPFLYLFATKFLRYGANNAYIGRFFTWCLQKGEKAGNQLQEATGSGMYIALLLFVGIPIPGTGAWTGILAASILGMEFKKSSLAVMGGVLLAGFIMAVASLSVHFVF